MGKKKRNVPLELLLLPFSKCHFVCIGVSCWFKAPVMRRICKGLQATRRQASRVTTCPPPTPLFNTLTYFLLQPLSTPSVSDQLCPSVTSLEHLFKLFREAPRTGHHNHKVRKESFVYFTTFEGHCLLILNTAVIDFISVWLFPWEILFLTLLVCMFMLHLNRISETKNWKQLVARYLLMFSFVKNIV